MEPRDEAADDHHLGGSQLPAEAHAAAGQQDEEGAAAQGPIPGRHKQQGSSSSPSRTTLAPAVTPLPAVALHQHPHQQGAPQAAQGEDGDSEGVEEGQGAGGQPVPVPPGPRGVVESLYVLQGRDTHRHQMGWQKGEDKGRQDLQRQCHGFIGIKRDAGQNMFGHDWDVLVSKSQHLRGLRMT